MTDDERPIAGGQGSLGIPAGRIRELYDWLRGSTYGLVALALVVGAGAGGGAVLFRYLILWFTEILTGRRDFSVAGRVGSPHFPGLGMYFLILVPVIGGLIYGPIVDRYAREARGHGVPEVMLAVAERGGRIGPQVAAVKSLASALCIGAGGSVGREGPIVQIGSALGSSIGQLLHVPERRLRLLVACGAAGGISATFNAPIAGVFFALELILRDFEAENFGMVVLASVTADVIGRAAFGDHPFLTLPTFHLASAAEYGLYAALGILAALAGVLFIRVLYGMEDLADRIWRGPEWLRPGVGGLLLGGLLLALPQMYGVGYPVLQNGIAGHYVWWFLLILLAGKIAATSLTIGIGGSGGVFAPSLFMGAMLGTAYGIGVHALFPGLTAPAGAYGLVGMGAVFAGAARAPITAVIIIFELTGDYAIILPLMAAIVLSAGVSHLLTADTIYTLKLRRRGIDILRGRAADLMQVLTVADAMQPVPAAIPAGATLEQIVDRLAASGADALPVTDTHGTYRGTLTTAETEQAARGNALDVTAAELARILPPLTTDQTLQSALHLLLAHERAGLPVLSTDHGRVVGWLTHRNVLSAYTHRLRTGAAQAHPRPATLSDYRIIDLELAGSSAPSGRRIADIPWPTGTRILAIRRKDALIPVTGRLELNHGDRLTILVPAGNADTLDQTIRT